MRWEWRKTSATSWHLFKEGKSVACTVKVEARWNVFIGGNQGGYLPWSTAAEGRHVIEHWLLSDLEKLAYLDGIPLSWESEEVTSETGRSHD